MSSGTGILVGLVVFNVA